MGMHAFIRFPPQDLKLIPRTWLLLGEVQATIEQLSIAPLPPEDANYMYVEYLAKAVHGTTAIEGNRLSEEAVIRLLGGDPTLDIEGGEELRQIHNMVSAYTAVSLDTEAEESPAFSIELLNKYHSLVLDGLETDEARAGQMRMHNVTVGRYLAPPPDDSEVLLEQFCDWLNTPESVPAAFVSYEQALGILKAIIAHVYFAWIHPYGDGNGRMARLIEYALLLRAGLPASAANVFSYRYSTSKDRYFAEMQDTHGELVDGAYRRILLGKFVTYALDKALEELERQVFWTGVIHTQALWRERIRAHFPIELTVPQQRRLQLAYDIVDCLPDGPLEYVTIWDKLDDIPTGEYEYSTHMLDLDISALVKMGILEQVAGGFQANRDIMWSLFGNKGVPFD